MLDNAKDINREDGERSFDEQKQRWEAYYEKHIAVDTNDKSEDEVQECILSYEDADDVLQTKNALTLGECVQAAGSQADAEECAVLVGSSDEHIYD